jgi:hypothetical protein
MLAPYCSFGVVNPATSLCAWAIVGAFMWPDWKLAAELSTVLAAHPWLNVPDRIGSRQRLPKVDFAKCIMEKVLPAVDDIGVRFSHSTMQLWYFQLIKE